MRYIIPTSCAFVLISGAASSEELGLMYNTLTLSGSTGGSYSIPGEPDKLQCKNLIVDGKVEVSAKGTAPETVGGTPGTVILVCDSVVFKPGSSLGTWSNLTIRTHDLSGDVVIEGLRKRGGRMGRNGSNGATGGSGGAGGIGKDGENGSDGEDNVTISVVSDTFENGTSFDIRTEGGEGGPGGNGGDGGNGSGGDGGDGGDGGSGGDGGAGGRGGDVLISTNTDGSPQSNVDFVTHLLVQGGRGGTPGLGGLGGRGGSGQVSGRPGRAGKNGDSGPYGSTGMFGMGSFGEINGSELKQLQNQLPSE